MDLVTHHPEGTTSRDADGRAGEVFDPATGEVARHVALATSDDVAQVVRSASRAFASWSATSLSRRSSLMFAVRETVAAHVDELAALITAEHGKTLADARGEVRRGLEVIEFACGIPHLLKGDHSENVSTAVDSWSLRQPLGVVAGVTPFNFPAMVPMWMFPLAVACGNTFVLKPSERVPSVANRLAELLAQAGLPDGVFNVVHGDGAAVDALLAHPDVKAVSFVGSTPVARHVYETASLHGKRVQALGGAKNHMVVLPDADLDGAADAAVSAAYGSAGQRCMAVSVVVAVGDVGDALVPLLRERVAGLRVGAGADPDTDIGPLVTREHAERVRAYVASGLDEGAELVVDGRDHAAGDEGFFLGPSLFDHVSSEMAIYRDEIFGPVLAVVRVDSLADAIELVNASPYGNGTAIFTRDGAAARRYQHAIEVGMVGINVPIPVPMAFYSFGGWKQSLFGSAHVHGAEGVAFYTRGKVVTGRWPEGGDGGLDLGFPTSS